MRVACAVQLDGAHFGPPLISVDPFLYFSQSIAWHQNQFVLIELSLTKLTKYLFAWEEEWSNIKYQSKEKRMGLREKNTEWQNSNPSQPELHVDLRIQLRFEFGLGSTQIALQMPCVLWFMWYTLSFFLLLFGKVWAFFCWWWSIQK